jgi:integrase
VTVNTYIGAMNAFCVWLHAEGHVVEPIKLAKLRVERRMLSILDDTQMRVLIGYKPTSLGQRRVHLAALLALDTGLRVSEVLHLRTADVDFDNLIPKVFGKGQKERFVPFSPDLRKRLYRFQQFKEKRGSRRVHLAGCTPDADRGVGHATSSATDVGTRGSARALPIPDPGPRSEVHCEFRRGVSHRRDRDRAHAVSGTAGECRRRAFRANHPK